MEYTRCVGSVAEGVGGGFVERMFWYCCRRWPLMLASDFGRCFMTRSTVRPGQVVKYPAAMAVIHVLGAGQKQHRCRYVAKSCLVLCSKALNAYSVRGAVVAQSMDSAGLQCAFAVMLGRVQRPDEWSRGPDKMTLS